VPTRGVWLPFLELLVMRFASPFNLDCQVTVITVPRHWLGR
jgi:hypothetical protein